jgi:hypothetical protein
MSAPHPGDKSAAFTGLILGAIAIFVICFAVVRLTNAKFAGHSPAGAAAPAAGQAAPAAGAH